MPSGRDSFRRNRVAPSVLSYFTMPPLDGDAIRRRASGKLRIMGTREQTGLRVAGFKLARTGWLSLANLHGDTLFECH
jgi:hypothetical protein